MRVRCLRGTLMIEWPDAAYADMVALCQFLPGPASSQVGIGLGYRRAGWPGAFAAWLASTLPSGIAMAALALGLQAVADVVEVFNLDRRPGELTDVAHAVEVE